MPDLALASDIANRSLHAFPGSTDFRPKFSGQHSREPLSWHYPPIEETEVTLDCFIEEEGRMLCPGESMRPDVSDSSRSPAAAGGLGCHGAQLGSWHRAPRVPCPCRLGSAHWLPTAALLKALYGKPWIRLPFPLQAIVPPSLAPAMPTPPLHCLINSIPNAKREVTDPLWGSSRSEDEPSHRPPGSRAEPDDVPSPSQAYSLCQHSAGFLGPSF